MTAVAAIIDRHARNFRAGRFDHADTCYATPLPVYTPKGVAVLRTKDDVRRALARHREAATSAATMDGDVIEARFDKTGRGKVVVGFRYGMPGGEVRRGLTTYYVEPGRRCGQIVMVDIHKQALDASLPTLNGAASAPGVLQ